eukprot:gene5597-2620_t
MNFLELSVLCFIPGSAVIGILFGFWLWVRVSRIQTGDALRGSERESLLEEQPDSEDMLSKVTEIQEAISQGATSFLTTEYKYMGVFMVIMATVICTLLSIVPPEDGRTSADERKNGIFSMIAFVLGALTSILSGFLGMKIATYANARTALEARKGVAPAFMCAFRSGAVMGFLLAGVGGGIYTKAADVGADLVGKIEKDIPEDDPRNPAVIADNVGDNVGDIAGMGSDLFGSFAESSCAALVISAVSSLGKDHDLVGMSFPLLIR